VKNGPKEMAFSYRTFVSKNLRWSSVAVRLEDEMAGDDGEGVASPFY